MRDYAQEHLEMLATYWLACWIAGAEPEGRDPDCVCFYCSGVWAP
jgi:hypothetical protein